MEILPDLSGGKRGQSLHNLFSNMSIKEEIILRVNAAG